MQNTKKLIHLLMDQGEKKEGLIQKCVDGSEYQYTEYSVKNAHYTLMDLYSAAKKESGEKNNISFENYSISFREVWENQNFQGYTMFLKCLNIISENKYDLFDHPWDCLPKAVRKVIQENNGGMMESYEDCAKMKKEMEKIGFTFDYGLDFCPYNLRVKDINTAENNY